MSLSFLKTTRYLLTAGLLFCFTISSAQDKYKKLGERIDSLANVGLSKSALKEVEELDALARAGNNAPQQVRAVIYRMTFQSYIEENALVAIITGLKADIDKAKFPVKPMLQSLLAQMYWQYYKENRYRFGRRTKLINQDLDFRNWNIQTIINETSHLYALSLSDAEKEQNTPVGVFDGVLEGDKETRYLRPTLYDLLVHRAFDFYLSDEASINKPRLPFKLNDARFFSDSRTFAGLDIKTSDTASTLYKGIKYLQQATLFHLEKNNRDALADIDIKRLGVLFNQATVTGKDSLYIKALRKVADDFPGSPVSAGALVLIGDYFKDKDSLVIAHSYFEKAMTLYPKSYGGKTAARSVEDIEALSLSATVEDVNVPGKPLLGLVSYSNVKEAEVSVYYLSPAQIQRLTGKKALIDQVYPGTDPRLTKLLKQLQPVQQQRLQLPCTEDYRKHSAEFKIDALPIGRYVIVVSNPRSKSRYLSQPTKFRITGLAYIARVLPGGQTELRVVNRDSGAPLPDVKVMVYRSDYSKNKNVKSIAFSGLSDVSGRYLFKAKNGEQYSFVFSYRNDNYIEQEQNFYNSGIADGNSAPVISTIFFTDRQLYRPGQSIYFKGLRISTADGKNSIMPGEDMKVSLQDINNKTLTERNLKSNEFGSVQGTFVIPQNIPGGQVTIIGVNGNATVRVEEYKRPTFQVTFLPVNSTYRPGDSVKIKGRVTAFSGYGLSNAKVAYHVTSRVMPVYDERFAKSGNIVSIQLRNGEVAADTIQTNDKGDFEARFKSMGDMATAYPRQFDYSDIYAVNADVTDASGETQTANTSIVISSKALEIDVAIPAKLAAADPASIVFRLNNANGLPQKGRATVKIFAMKQPQQFTKDRVWQNPDQFILPRDEFKRAFPTYPWKRENDPAGLEVLNKLSEVNIIADSTAGRLDLGMLKKQANGVYKIVINARSETGDTASLTRFIKVANGAAPALGTEDWGLTTTVKPGETPEYLLGIDRPSHVLMEKYDGPKLLSSEWITLGGPYRQTIKVPVPATKQNSFGVQFLRVIDNRAHIFYNQIRVMDSVKQLPIRFITFRNKLQPGEKEQWKLQIAGTDENAAEMLATLYDVSLDDIAPAQYWRTDYAYYPPYGSNYFTWIRPQLAQETTAEWSVREDGMPAYPPNTDYEQLNLFGYAYYGGNNRGYNNYLEQVKEYLADQEADKKLAAGYFKNAALIKNGYEISGTVLFGGRLLKGAKITIKNTAISTWSSSKGRFKIKVPVKGVLVFSLEHYPGREIKTKAATQLAVEMERNYKGPVLEELKVADAGVKSLKGDENVSYMYAEPIGNSDVKMTRFNAPAVKADMVFGYSAAAAPAPSKAMQYDEIRGRVTMREIRTKMGEKFKNLIINPRKNFSETAFFYPQLHTDEKGQILVDFTIPETLTRWKFRGFAHNKDLQTGYIENEVITQKQLSISANMPRFLREGDTIAVSARLANLTDKTIKGFVKMQLFNALNMQPINIFLGRADPEQDFEVEANTNKAMTFNLVIPAGLGAITYRLTANAGQFTDGEENTLPVLPNRTLVTESMPMMVRAGQSRSFMFDKLLNQNSKTLQNKTLTLEYTQNPAWYAVQALPYMMEFPYECSEQIFSRYYANSLATNLLSKLPAIKQVFDQWKSGNSTELLSNLEKNQELKSTLIEETPWLKDAVSETEQKKRIALLFDLNKMSDELRLNLDKLQKKQLPDGGFPWFGGDRSDRYITQHILQGIGEMRHLNIKDEKLDTVLLPALNYMDRVLTEDDKAAKKTKDYATRPLSAIEIQAWFARSFFLDQAMDDATGKIQANYLKRAESQWTTQNVYEQTMIALTMQRYKKPAVTQQIEKSLLETAQQSDDMGMYWAKNQRGYFWYESPVETQSMLIELFTEAGDNAKVVEEMKIWLLRNKQANNWKTTTATAAACYALLLKGDNILANNGTSAIKLNGKPLEDLKPEVKTDAGTGYIKTSWVDEQVKPSLGKIDIKNSSTNLSWGVMHWQYLENLDKITSAQTNIQLERKYYIQKQTDAGAVLVAVDGTHQPKTGDLLKVVINLKADRDFEYVQLKDLRPAGTEPVDVLSAYKYQDGLYYYQVSRDVATNFFISYLNKGNYVFEYQLRVAQPGNFSTGMAIIQSMYTPEFNAHSAGGRMEIKQ